MAKVLYVPREGPVSFPSLSRVTGDEVAARNASRGQLDNEAVKGQDPNNDHHSCLSRYFCTYHTHTPYTIV